MNQSSELKKDQGPPVEGSTFAEYTSSKTGNGLKSKESKGESSGLDVAYSSTTKTNVEAKPPTEGASFAEYKSTDSVGIKSTTVNASVNANPNLEKSVGYNSMDGEYSSTTKSRVESKPSNEGASFAEYKSTDSVGIKSTIKPQNVESSTGYNSQLGEYPTTASVGIKTTTVSVNVPVNANPNLTASTGYNSMDGEYSSTTKSRIESKPSNEGASFAEYKSTDSVGIKSTMKPQNVEASTGYNSQIGEYPATASVGIKSTTVSVNVPVNVNPNLTASTGYNSMEGEYTSTTKSKIESKPSNEGATFAEYKSTDSVGIKSTINPQNMQSSTGYNSMTGPYASTSVPPNNTKLGQIPLSVSINSPQPNVNPLIMQVPGGVPIINTNVPVGTVQTTYIVTTTTNPVGLSQIPLSTTTIQPMQPGQPLAASTFATYPVTTSHGIKSSINNQPM